MTYQATVALEFAGNRHFADQTLASRVAYLQCVTGWSMTPGFGAWPLRRRRRAAVTAQAARVGAARRGHESTPAAGGAICAVHASGGEGEGGEWGERRRAREGESEGEGEGVGEGERARVWARGTEERERMQRARGRKLGTVVRA